MQILWYSKDKTVTGRTMQQYCSQTPSRNTSSGAAPGCCDLLCPSEHKDRVKPILTCQSQDRVPLKRSTQVQDIPEQRLQKAELRQTSLY